jgi:hypothetical protein
LYTAMGKSDDIDMRDTSLCHRLRPDGEGPLVVSPRVTIIGPLAGVKVIDDMEILGSGTPRQPAPQTCLSLIGLGQNHSQAIGAHWARFTADGARDDYDE